MVNNSVSVRAATSLAEVTTLIEMLAFRAKQTPDQVAFTINNQSVNFQDLWENVQRFATFLLNNGISKGDRVVLVIPNSEEFFYAYYGVQRAGAIPAPIFAHSGPDRIFSIAKLCGAKAVVAYSEGDEAVLNDIEAQANKLNMLACTVLDAEDEALDASTPFPPIVPTDIAFIQYTSGSTGNPKGVQLSHQNILANVRQMIEGNKITEHEIFVSWLPVYHDLGLIVMTICPFYLGAELHLLPTDLNVRRWLETITKTKATVTAAPDMGYRLCIRNIKNPAEYDLSSLRLAVNAAEPVRAKTIDEFEKKFGVTNIIKPGYGLAEASVGVSLWTQTGKVKIDERGFVSVGKPLPGVEIQIIQDGQVLSAGQVGAIVVRSPATTIGYYNNPEETAKLFWKDGFLFTGDLGYIDADGDLFIVGREKSIIISTGRTIAPQELEEVVDVIPNVRCSAAVGIDKDSPDGEQIYVFAEVRLNELNIEKEGQEVVREIVKNINSRLGFRPGRVYLVKPHTIPLTYNGKVRHSTLRDDYLNGTLNAEKRILFPNY
jgi:fatty-acyl-CoA synthase